MKYRVLVLLVLVLCIEFSLTSCSLPTSLPTSDQTSTSEAKIDIQGRIMEVHQAGQQDREKGLLGAISVEGEMQGGQSAQVSVAVTTDTRLLQQEGQSRRPITFESMTAGQSVQVTFRGPVAETYPLQGTAAEIVIIVP